MRKLLLIAPLLLLVGCYKTELRNFSNNAGAPGTEVKVWSSAVLWGLVPLTEIDVRSYCGDKGVYAVSTRQSVVNVILNGLTGGIYSPTTAVITCNQ